MSDISDFFAKRKRYQNEYFACPGSTKTVMISSFVWWTELIAFSLLKLGYNVLIAEPWYYFWTDDEHFANFDRYFDRWARTLRKFNVQLVIGGNTTAMVPHPRTKELLHRAAGVPAVHYWWDEPRTQPPMSRRGLTPHDYMAAMRNARTLNVFWDADVREEMERFLALDNTAHVPLGTTPEFWETTRVPLRDRPLKLCFLGNNHDEGDWVAKADPQVVRWARQVVEIKLAQPDKSMADCVETIGGPGEVRGSTARRPYELAANLKDEFERWGILGGILLQKVRNVAVQAAAEHLKEGLTLIGKGWERLGLRATKEHSGVPGAKDYYASSKASLNLFGGCVHGGLPLRPYEIASSHGLIFTRYNRELPSLYEPGKECIAFQSAQEMTEKLDRILSRPEDFEAVVEAGRRRTIAEHTWEHRMRTVLSIAKDRFDLPW